MLILQKSDEKQYKKSEVTAKEVKTSHRCHQRRPILDKEKEEFNKFWNKKKSTDSTKLIIQQGKKRNSIVGIIKI